MKTFKPNAKMSHGGHYCWGGKVMKKAEGGSVKSSKVKKEDEDYAGKYQNVQEKMGLPVSVYVDGKYDSDLSKKVMQENFDEGLRQSREEHGKKMKEEFGSDEEDYSYKYPTESYDSVLPKGKSYKTKATENMKRGGKVKAFWETKNPKKESKPLSSSQKSFAKARAAKAGRSYPNLVDNSAASRRSK